MSKESFPLSKVYGLLEPGPVVLVTTAREGRANIMTLSWHTMMDFEPPMLACVINNGNFTFDILKATKQCVINIPTVELSRKVVDCGNCSGRTVDKFNEFSLTPIAASCVNAPLIDECYANLECKVVDDNMVAKYNLFILEVIKAWINPREVNPQTIHHMGEGAFMVAGETIRLPSKMK
jgi:flavin reductase (DIM6/NTAB) family NADH-FMN oxidoreductase RutF